MLLKVDQQTLLPGIKTCGPRIHSKGTYSAEKIILHTVKCVQIVIDFIAVGYASSCGYSDPYRTYTAILLTYKVTGHHLYVN